MWLLWYTSFSVSLRVRRQRESYSIRTEQVATSVVTPEFKISEYNEFYGRRHLVLNGDRVVVFLTGERLFSVAIVGWRASRGPPVWRRTFRPRRTPSPWSLGRLLPSFRRRRPRSFRKDDLWRTATTRWLRSSCRRLAPGSIRRPLLAWPVRLTNHLIHVKYVWTPTSGRERVFRLRF